MTQTDGTRRIDIGGYSLEIRCEGSGAPTVVFENGGLPVVDIFIDFKQVAGERWRVCSYDRAGTGKSEPGPSPRSAAQIARELDALLTAAGESPPFILVASSAGALYTIAYATMFGDRVAGIVLADPRTPAYHVAVPRLLDDPEKVRLLGLLPPAYAQEFESWDIDAPALAAATLPDIPMVVLTAGSAESAATFVAPADDQSIWIKTHADLAASVPRGRHVIVPDAEHKIWERKPAALLDAIADVARAAQTQAP